MPRGVAQNAMDNLSPWLLLTCLIMVSAALSLATCCAQNEDLGPEEEGGINDTMYIPASLQSAAIHPISGHSCALVLKELQVDMRLRDYAKAHITVTYSMHNPSEREVTERFLLPFHIQTGMPSMRQLYCWLYGWMDVRLNQSFLRPNITQDQSPLKFNELDNDQELHEFMEQFMVYNRSARIYGGRNPFHPLTFEVTVPAQSNTTVITEYYQACPFWIPPTINRSNTSKITIRGSFGYLTASAGMWTDRAKLGVSFTIDEEFYTSSHQPYKREGDCYVYEYLVDDWSPVTRPTSWSEWTVWEGQPDKIPSIHEHLLNYTYLTELPWENRVDEKILIQEMNAMIRTGVDSGQNIVLVNATIRGGEEVCLIPVLNNEMHGRWWGSSSFTPPTGRSGSKYLWELQFGDEPIQVLLLQIAIWNNDQWILSPLTLLRGMELERWESTIPVKLWIQEDGGNHDDGLRLIFQLPRDHSLQQPSCQYTYYGRGIPSGREGPLETVGDEEDGFYQFLPEDDSTTYQEVYRDRLEDGVAFTYVWGRDENGEPHRSEIFVFEVGEGLNYTTLGEYANPSTDPCPITEHTLALVYLLPIAILIARDCCRRESTRESEGRYATSS